MPEAAHFTVRLRDGRQFGPGPMELLAKWAREGRIPSDAMIADDHGAARPALEVPELAVIVQAPPTVSTGPPALPESPMTGLIPYRNPAALGGYYLAIFSLIPVLGLVLGPAAVLCGGLGLRGVLKNARARGTAHAWVAIVLGALTGLGNGLVLLLIMIA